MNGNGDDALKFYTSVFKYAEVLNAQYQPGQNAGSGKLFTATIKLEGIEFMILNWPNDNQFTPAISFFVKCKDQAEVDDLWYKLLDGGKPMQCGWLTDRFGIAWQIIPDALGKLMGDPDRVKAQRVMQAMMKMVKLDVAELERAYNQEV